MPKCKWSQSLFIEKSKLIHQNKFDYSLVSFKTINDKIIVICNTCKNQILLLPSTHLRGSGCKKCNYKTLSQNQPFTNEKFLKKAFDIHKNQYLYLSLYIKSSEKVKMQCTICNFIFEQTPHHHLRGRGCPKCKYKKLKQNLPINIEVYEKRCQEIHENKYTYYQDFKGMKHKIKINCPIHKYDFFQEANAHLHKKQGCPKCNTSKAEKIITKYLNEHNILYYPQHKFKNCVNVYRLAFDFYLPQYDLCIEYDGEQHFKEVEFFGGKKRLLQQKKLDNIKNNYCLEKNIKLVRIPYTQQKNLISILKFLFT